MPKGVLKQAEKLQADAALAGFDWPDIEGIFQKLEEELGELREAVHSDASLEEVRAEMGDLLFVLVNLARRLDIDMLDALDGASGKFERRFGYVCDELRKLGRLPQESSLDEMELLWQQAKRLEAPASDDGS